MAQETDIEKYLISRVAKLGGKQVKHVSPGTNGEPDRLIKLPGHPAALLELKRPRGPGPEPLQLLRIQEWLDVGMLAGYAHTMTDVEKFLQRIKLQ